MALYVVTRTDNPGPGEFVDAHVIAGGVAQARALVSHLEGVTKTNVVARRVDVTKAPNQVISTYFDERPTPITVDVPIDRADDDLTAGTDYDSALVEPES